MKMIGAVIALVACALSTGMMAQERPRTLRSTLSRAKFPVPGSVPAADLDRTWNDSSSWDANATYFAAAIHFEDERRNEMHLGPLHLIRIAKSGEVIRHRLADDEGLLVGDSPAVEITPPYVLVHSHASPSAGLTLVLDASFTPVKSLFTLGTDVLADGTILYKEGLVHFADIKQQNLRVFDPVTKRDLVIFPGSTASPFGARLLQRVRRAEARIAEEFGREVSAGEPIVTFDRGFGIKRISSDSRVVALAVHYVSDKFVARYHDLASYRPVLGPRPQLPNPSFWTVVRCSRGDDGAWTCQERLGDEVAKAHKLPVPAAWYASDLDAAKLLDAAIRDPLSPKP